MPVPPSRNTADSYGVPLVDPTTANLWSNNKLGPLPYGGGDNKTAKQTAMYNGMQPFSRCECEIERTSKSKEKRNLYRVSSTENLTDFFDSGVSGSGSVSRDGGIILDILENRRGVKDGV